MSFSDYAASDFDWTETRPDKALVVKCSYDGLQKRITFSSTRTCSYELLRQRVEQCFSLSATPYAITYTDDDGEVTDISTDSDLTEAIRYFYPASEDAPVSSSASILSGRSLTKGKITLRVRISVDYDGPSLSDTSSLVSLEEYKDRNGSEFSLSLSSVAPGEVDDDSVTVSSKDLGSKYDLFRTQGSKTLVNAPSQEPLISRSPHPPATESEVGTISDFPSTLASAVLDGVSEAHTSEAQNPFTTADELRYLENPSSVFERLKLEEDMQSRQPDSSYGSSTLHTERGAAWLREQTARTVTSVLGDLPTRPESVDLPDENGSVMSGELALQQDVTSGKFYYTYVAPSLSAGSQSAHDSGYDDGVDADASVVGTGAQSRPTSMDVGWFDAQESSLQAKREKQSLSRHSSSSASSSSSNLFNANRRSYSEPSLPPNYIHPDVPPEVLPFIGSMAPAPPQDLTTCSECGQVLDAIRYVCSSCGEKKPQLPPGQSPEIPDARKGKDKAVHVEVADAQFLYSPPSHSPTGSFTSSSWSVVTGPHGNAHLPSFSDTSTRVSRKPLPAIPRSNGGFHSLTSEYANGDSCSPTEVGYELCWGCIESSGVTHALEMSLAPGSSPGPGDWSASPEDAQRALSQWRRSAPSQKGQLRHAFIEKSWGHRGWQDVEQDEHRSCMCSGCDTLILNHRFKCASCKNFNLCRACYSQVHEIHPSHAFLVVPDHIPRSRSEPILPVPTGELSMTHYGVKCAHCLQDIVGARFHCAICESVDICANCESAGLPGNLDSSDGGHNSSHIMIKIPYPLGTAELQSASRTAKLLWAARDAAATGQRPCSRSRRDSLLSSYSRTVLGSGSRTDVSLENASVTPETDDHGISCNNCGQPINGVRYQCAGCSSKPKAYSLCASCEERSYMVHDPMHVFFKFSRPLHRPLRSDYPLLGRVYKVPAGPPPALYDPANPKEYLKVLYHPTAVCDCCMTRITGVWYRCAYCSRDLCEVCEDMDTHNSTHAFVVFKSPVDMHMLRHFTDFDNQNGSPPIIPYPIYHSEET